MAVYVKGVNAYYKSTNKLNNPIKPWTIRDVIALNAIKSELFGEGGGAEVGVDGVLDGLQDSLGRDQGTSRSGTTCAAPGPRDPVSIPSSFPYGPPASRSGNRGAGQRLVPARAHAGATPPGGQRRVAAQASNVLMVAGKRSRLGPSAVRRRPADRLLLPGPDARDGPPRPRLERPRRDLGAVPRLHPDRPRARTSSGRSPRRARTSSTSTSRRSATAATPSTCTGASAVDDALQRRHDRQPAGDLQPHGARAGGRLRDRRRPRVAISRKRSSYLLDGVDLLLFQRSRAARSATPRRSSRRRRSPRRRSTRSTRTARRWRRSPRGACRAARAWTRACRRTARQLRVEGLPAAKDHPQAIVKAAC